MPPKPAAAPAPKKRGDKDKKEPLTAEEEKVILQRELDALKQAYGESTMRVTAHN